MSYLFDSLQHGAATLPRLGPFADAGEACHAVPLAVLQLPVEGIGQQQHCVIDVAVGDLTRWGRRETEKELVIESLRHLINHYLTKKKRKKHKIYDSHRKYCKEKKELFGSVLAVIVHLVHSQL